MKNNNYSHLFIKILELTELMDAGCFQRKILQKVGKILWIHPIMHYVMHSLIQMFPSIALSPCQNIYKKGVYITSIQYLR